MPWQLEDTHGVTETLFRPLTDEERMEQSRTVPEADISLDLEQLSISSPRKRTGRREGCHGTGLVYHPDMGIPKCLWDDTYEENPQRFIGVQNRIEQLGLAARCVPLSSRLATEEEILAIHSKEHFDKMASTENVDDLTKLEELSSNYDAVYFHPRTFEMAKYSSGATIDMITAIVEDKIKNGFAMVRPPGHHAMREEACGYCFFNNVAIAAKHALDNLDVGKVLIVDWDVHHGQATQYSFYYDPRVFYISIHRYEHGKFWPELIESNFNHIGVGKGRGFNLNIPLNETGINDKDYLAIFNNLILPLAYQFNPDLVIVSAGYDAAIGCPEGEMRVSPATYAHLTHKLMALANGRVCVALEGGYCIKSLSEGAALTLKTLLGDPCPEIITLDHQRLHKSVIESILDCIYAIKVIWEDTFPLQGVFERQLGGDNGEVNVVAIEHGVEDVIRARHYPLVDYRGKLGINKPTKYETRNCYPVQDPETKFKLDQEIEFLIQNTNIEYKLVGIKRTALAFDQRMAAQEHFNKGDKGHPERPSRAKSIWAQLTATGLVERCNLIASRAATDEELLLCHSKDHVMMMSHLVDCQSDQELKDLAGKFDSIYFSKATNQIARLATGSLINVVDSVVKGDNLNGFAVIRPPGHHAAKNIPSGFCFFNNVAIAANYAIKNLGVKRVLIVDWDVHHGDGIQKLVEGREDIVYISVHRYDFAQFFPENVISGHRTGFKNIINVPWNGDKMSDEEYVSTMVNVILPIGYDFNPDLVLVSAGFDAAINDPIGHFKLSPKVYGHLTHHLMSLARGRVVMALEGGYNLITIANCAEHCVRALLGDSLPELELERGPLDSAATTLKDVVDYHHSYWPSMQFGVDLPVNDLPE